MSRTVIRVPSAPVRPGLGRAALLCGAALAVLGTANPSWGQSVTYNDETAVIDTDQNIEGELTVGMNAPASLTVREAAAVTVAGQLFVGLATGGDGALAIEDGSSVIAQNVIAGVDADATGAITVRGSGLLQASSLMIGSSGGGVLTLAEGGIARVGNGLSSLQLADVAGATGVLNIGAALGEAPLAPGYLEASQVSFRHAGAVTFNHTDEAYEFHAEIVGPAALRQAAGRTILTGQNTYTGSTSVTGGELVIQGRASGGGVLSTGNGDVTMLDGSVMDTANTYLAGAAGTVSSNVMSGSAVWTTDDVYIGQRGEGSLLIQDGARMSTSGLGSIGRSANSDPSGVGRVTVRGEGARWTPSTGLYVGAGAGGDARLDIEDGGLVQTGWTHVGRSAATGVLSVSGGGALTASSMTVGGGGTGTLRLFDGGAVTIQNGAGTLNLGETETSAGHLILGAAAGEAPVAAGVLDAGTVNMAAGANSFTINHLGEMTLDAAITGFGVIDHYAGRTTLSGAGAFSGETNLLGGALVLAHDDALGVSSLNARATGAVVSWADGVTTDNTIMLETEGVQFEVLDGTAIHAGVIAQVNGPQGFTKIGAGELVLTRPSAFVGSILVQDGGLAFDGAFINLYDPDQDLSYDLTVDGAGGADARAVVRGGGDLRVGAAYLGQQAGGQGALAVSGAGSTLNASLIYAGGYGQGRLSFAEGAVANSAQAYFGFRTGATGEVLVTGAGTDWTNTVDLVVGYDGSGELTVADQARVETSRLMVGYDGDGAVTVDSGGRLLASSTLTVGLYGGGDLTVRDGGQVMVSGGMGAISLATDAGSVGALNIGAASGQSAAAAGVVDAAEVVMGAGAGGLIFNHLSEGYVFNARLSGDGVVQNEAGLTTLTGDNSEFSGDYYVLGGSLALEGANGQGPVAGQMGSGSVLSVEAEAYGEAIVNGGGGFIGRVIAADGQGEGLGIVRVQGQGSSAEATELYAGAMGRGEIVVSDQGVLTVEQASLGEYGHGELTVTGSAEANVWAVNSGVYGRGAVTVSDGGVLRTGWIYGADGAGTVSDITVTGAQSSLEVENTLELARSGRGSLNVRDGAVVFARTLQMSQDSEAEGRVTVSGAGAQLTVLGEAGLGMAAGGQAAMTVAEGGRFSAAGLAVGYGAETGGELMVTGPGSRVTVTGIGIGYGGNGVAVLSDGGVLALEGPMPVVNLAYEAGSTGALVIGGEIGSAPQAAGGLSAEALVFGEGEAALIFNHSDDQYDFSTALNGAGAMRQLAGATHLTGDSLAFTGVTSVEAGALHVDGQLGGDVTLSGGVLAGAGLVNGAVTATGGALEGRSGQTLSMGALTLAADARTNVRLGDPANGAGALFDVAGNLTLDGTLNVFDAGQMGAGVYRLFDYGGALTDNGLSIDQAPVGYAADDLRIQTSQAGQVNLVNLVGAELRFWDGDGAGAFENGVIDGGAGVWSLNAQNWTDTDGDRNGSNRPVPSLAVFTTAAGEVTLDDADGALEAAGLQFAVDGYRLSGDALTLREAEADGGVTLRVGDGTEAGAAMRATVAADLDAASRTAKTDLGALTLTGDNQFLGLDVRQGELALAGGATAADQIMVGLNAGDDGRLTVEGAALQAASLTLAGHADAAGALWVRGADAETTIAGHLIVGAEGDGTLVIHEGGVVESRHAAIGAAAGGAGTATISGDGSIWRVDGSALVGGDGAGAVTLSDGGRLRVGSGEGLLTVAAAPGGSGEVAVGARAGQAAAGAGDLEALAVAFGAGQGSLTFNHTETDYVFVPGLQGQGGVLHLAGTTRLIGEADLFEGLAAVEGGVLIADTALGGDVNVTDGVLTGSGAVLGAVKVADGGVLAGRQGAVFGLGSLTLAPGAVVEVGLGAVSDLALFDVDGDLTLDGELRVADTGGFGVGVYRLFDYGGALTDNGLSLDEAPLGVAVSDLSVQTSVAGQVNLISASGADLSFWDGAGPANDGTVQGGAGTWAPGLGNWTTADGAVNGAYAGPAYAVFQGEGGVVTTAAAPSGEGISVSGMQFAADGYRIQGQAVSLAEAETVIRVGDGTAAGADMTATIAADLTGAGGLVKADLGTLILTGQNSYQGGVHIRQGVLVAGVDSLSGDVVNDATLVIDQDEDGAFGGAISGSGDLVKDGAGVVTLTGALTYTGATRILDGRLIADAAALSGPVFNDAVLTFDQSEDGVYDSDITGDGALVKTGAGGLNLTGTNTYTGPTTVQQGLLRINGSVTSTVTVEDGGGLGGAGVIGGLIAESGGVVAPGNSIGTLNVSGDVTFQPGSVYEVETDPESDASDRIAADGQAVLNGGLVRHVGEAGAYRASTTYTILTADGGVTGTFDAVETDFAFLDAALSYQTNAVLMTLERNDTAFPDVGRTFNQRAVGAAVEATGADTPLYDAVIALNAPGARQAFDALSGALHGSIRMAQSEGAARLRGALTGRLDAARDTPEGLAFWGRASGARGRVSGDGEAGGLGHGAAGLALGADAGFGDARIGVMIQGETLDYDSRNQAGQADGTSFSLAAYGAARWGALGLKGGAGGTWHEVDTERQAVFPGFAQTLRADYEAVTAQAFAEATWSLSRGPATLEPYVGVARVRTETDAFAETGGSAALTAGGRVQAFTTAEIGLGARRAFDQGDGRTAALSGRIGWRHAWGDLDSDARHAFADSPTAFTVRGLPVAEDALTARLALDVQLRERAAVTVDWTAAAAEDRFDSALNARIAWRF